MTAATPELVAPLPAIARDPFRPLATLAHRRFQLSARTPRELIVPLLTPILFALVIAEIGDISRFPSARHLCAWAGLTPTVRSSDRRTRLGHISGQGSPALGGPWLRPPSTLPPAAVRCVPATS